jgi:hypothetical protein
VTGAGSTGLERIEHLVVLMLENRSFDHMLGYLSLEGARADVDGLRPEMVNERAGRRYPIHHLSATYFPDERWDPEHSAVATDRQIDDGATDGFCASYADTLASRGVEDGDLGVVMGYYSATDLPVFDHFAAEFHLQRTCSARGELCPAPGARPVAGSRGASDVPTHGAFRPSAQPRRSPPREPEDLTPGGVEVWVAPVLVVEGFDSELRELVAHAGDVIDLELEPDRMEVLRGAERLLCRNVEGGDAGPVLERENLDVGIWRKHRAADCLVVFQRRQPSPENPFVDGASLRAEPLIDVQVVVPTDARHAFSFVALFGPA